MGVSSRFLSYLLFALAFMNVISSAAKAVVPDSGDDWDVEKEVPSVTVIGNVSDKEQQIADDLRNHLIENLAYWKSKGLPNPPNLKSIIYISGVDEVRVSEILKMFNPDMPNVIEHIREQYFAFNQSALIDVIEVFEKFFKKPKGTWTTSFFDTYVFNRYGFTVKNVIDAINRNKKFREVVESEMVPLVDNAFYAQNYTIDLSEVLVPRSQSIIPKSVSEITAPKKFFDIISSGIVFWKKLEDHLTNTQRILRIVILPRSTQEVGDVDISTLSDFSVTTHEQGHHINKALAGAKNQIHRIVDEVFADYLAAAPIENPKIGEFFAKASGVIAARLKTSPFLSDQRMVERLLSLSKQGAIRDLSESSNIDLLSRVYLTSDNYSSGDPLRKFIWDLRKESQKAGIVEQLDKTVLEALYDHARLPKLYSTRSALVLKIRKSIQQLRLFISQLYIEILIRQRVKTIKDKFRAARIQARIKRIIQYDLVQKENSKIAWRYLWQSIGLGTRQPILADYVLPEFFRSFYRMAKTNSPELAKMVRRHAEVAMNSRSILIVNKFGTEELVFVRTYADKLNLIARRKLYNILGDLEELRVLISNINSDDSTEVTKVLKNELNIRYSEALERLQEYERTGSTFRLFFPHPVLGAMTVCERLLTSNHLISESLK